MSQESLNQIIELKTKEFHKDRTQGIGGSEVAAIAGLSKWTSPMEIYLEKIGAFKPEDPGEAAYWGVVLEDIVAQEFARQTGLEIIKQEKTLQHPDYPFMLANIDRMIVDKKAGNGVLECKTVSEYLKTEWEEDKVPDYYFVQVQHYLAVTGLSYAYIAALIGGNKFKYKYIPRDNEIIKYLIKIEQDFWSLVETRTPPELDGSAASIELVKLLFPQANHKQEISLPTQAIELIQEYEKADAVEKKAKENKEAAANKLKAMLGYNEYGSIENRMVAWKNIEMTRFDSKQLKKEEPELYEKYLKTTKFRKFSIREQGGNYYGKDNK